MYARFLIPDTVYAGIIHVLDTPSGWLPSAVYYYLFTSLKLTQIYILPRSFSFLCCIHLSHTDTLALSHTPWGYMCVGSVWKLWQR